MTWDVFACAERQGTACHDVFVFAAAAAADVVVPPTHFE